MRPQQETEFVHFVEGVSPRLLTTAWMLTGEPATAEDLVQEALERVYVRWAKVAAGNPTAYARKIMVNLHHEGWRKRRREVLSHSPPEREAPVRRDGHVDLVRALQRLPERQRECVVLRHYADLSEQQVADTLGVSLGTVKSSTARGLQALRTLMISEENHV